VIGRSTLVCKDGDYFYRDCLLTDASDSELFRVCFLHKIELNNCILFL